MRAYRWFGGALEPVDWTEERRIERQLTGVFVAQFTERYKDTVWREHYVDIGIGRVRLYLSDEERPQKKHFIAIEIEYIKRLALEFALTTTLSNSEVVERACELWLEQRRRVSIPTHVEELAALMRGDVAFQAMCIVREGSARSGEA